VRSYDSGGLVATVCDRSIAALITVNYWWNGFAEGVRAVERIWYSRQPNGPSGASIRGPPLPTSAFSEGRVLE
jgi:hypothetical protein